MGKTYLNTYFLLNYQLFYVPLQPNPSWSDANINNKLI